MNTKGKIDKHGYFFINYFEELTEIIEVNKTKKDAEAEVLAFEIVNKMHNITLLTLLGSSRSQVNFDLSIGVRHMSISMPAGDLDEAIRTAFVFWIKRMLMED